MFCTFIQSPTTGMNRLQASVKRASTPPGPQSSLRFWMWLGAKKSSGFGPAVLIACWGMLRILIGRFMQKDQTKLVGVFETIAELGGQPAIPTRTRIAETAPTDAAADAEAEAEAFAEAEAIEGVATETVEGG